MQIPYLVRAVVSHADDIAAAVIAELRHSPETPASTLLTDADLRWHLFDVYSKLGKWLEDRAVNESREAYHHLGRRRCEEGIPLSEMVFGLLTAKRHLLRFIRRNAGADTLAEHFELEDLNAAIGHFFDTAVYSAVKGHEGARRAGLWNSTPLRGPRGQYPGGVPARGAA